MTLAVTVKSAAPSMAEQRSVLSGLKFLPANLPAKLALMEESLSECRAFLAVHRPSPSSFFAQQVERLATHYPEGKLTPGEQKVVMADWFRLLRHVPADILADGVDAYLLTPARFFPTPGQFLELIESKIRYREALARRAQAALDLAAGKAAT